MNVYVNNIEQATLENENFRKVLFTGKNSQLVVMTIQPGEDIGMEVHEGHDQFIRIEEGSGKAILDGQEYKISAEWAIVIPAGIEHNVVNTGEVPLKLYTLYAPPEHKHGIVHATKADAEASEEHFDGVTSF